MAQHLSRKDRKKMKKQIKNDQLIRKIFLAVKDSNTADKISRFLFDDNMVADIEISDNDSRLVGDVESDMGIKMVMTTTQDRVPDITNTVRTRLEGNNYELVVITPQNLNEGKSYVNWVMQNTVKNER